MGSRWRRKRPSAALLLFDCFAQFFEQLQGGIDVGGKAPSWKGLSSRAQSQRQLPLHTEMPLDEFLKR
jgi:hypothetical protein